MSWEHFEEVYPDGAETNEYGFITAQELRQNPDAIAVTVPVYYVARNTRIKDESHIYGANNEYALGISYDVYDQVQHPDIIYPLSVYGQIMVSDYLYLHPEIKADP